MVITKRQNASINNKIVQQVSCNKLLETWVQQNWDPMLHLPYSIIQYSLLDVNQRIFWYLIEIKIMQLNLIEIS